MQDIIEFETRLAEITIPQSERRDEEKLYNLMPLSELQAQAPFVSDNIIYNNEKVLNDQTSMSFLKQMSWVEYFQNAMRLVGKKVNNKVMIVNFAPQYFVNLTTIIEEYKETPEKTV